VSLLPRPRIRDITSDRFALVKTSGINHPPKPSLFPNGLSYCRNGIARHDQQHRSFVFASVV
jgi:hypothetical protein